MKLSRLLTVFILFHILISASAQEQVVTLEQAIALALEKNYDVRVAKNFKESAVDRRQIIRWCLLSNNKRNCSAPGT